MQDRIVSYSGDEYGLREVQNLLLNILEKFDEHCRIYNITYSLAYGSMLGCVRNHGFIPWDDDVDVVMSRQNFDRLFESLKTGDSFLAKDCFVEMPSFLPKLHDRTSSSIPVYIDIYAADNVPDNKLQSMLKLYEIQFVKEIINGRCYGYLPGIKYKLRNLITYGLSFPFSINKIRNLFTRLCVSDNQKQTKRMGSYYTGHESMGRYYPSVFFSDVIYLDFETIKLPVMTNYQTYLSSEYGANYLVPIVRKPKHVKNLDR